MKKATAFLKPIFTFAAVVALLSSCAKTDYDGSLRLRGTTNNNPQAQQQDQRQGRGGDNQTNPDATLGDGNLPLISFTQSEVLMDSKLEAKLELQLSEASDKPVVAQVDLIDGSAKHYRDYTGFRTPSRNNETLQTIIFAPGETRKQLPVIGGRVRYADTSRACNSQFMARINAMKLEGARVVSDRAQVIVPCSTDRADILPPLPEPTPGRSCELPVAAFESNLIEVPVGADIALARIVLNKTAEENVYIDVEASSRFRVKTFEPYQERVMIPKGQRSVDIRINVKRQDVCCLTPAPQGDTVTGRFDIVVTSIANATMENRLAEVAIKDNAARCNRQPSPPTAPMPTPAQPMPPAQPSPPAGPMPPVQPMPPVTPMPPAPVQPELPAARFEQEQMNTGRSDMITSKIVLNMPAPSDVTIEIETQDGTALGDVDYVPLKLSLTIKKDESSIDIPLALIARDKCALDAPADAGKGGEFKLTVTNISNATMETKTANIVIPEDTRNCAPVATPDPDQPAQPEPAPAPAASATLRGA